jgi:hypothetical protein
MKPLPKKFQFKCDEHSLDQCKKLGIELNGRVNLLNSFYLVEDKKVLAGSNLNWTDIHGNIIQTISLADYIEEETEEQKIERLLNEAILSMPKEKFNKIVQKVNAMSIKEEPSYPDLIIERLNRIIHLLENTQFLNELKEKGYIK